jgi:hypothetical protein
MEGLGITDPVFAQRMLQRYAVNWTLARCMYRLITSGTLRKVDRDPYLGYFTFTWVEETEHTGVVSLEMLIQPSALLKLPHSHENPDSGTCDAGTCNVLVDAYQIFAMAFDAIVNHQVCDMPTVDENAQTSGAAVIYNDDVFLKLYIPGVQ